MQSCAPSSLGKFGMCHRPALLLRKCSLTLSVFTRMQTRDKAPFLSYTQTWSRPGSNVVVLLEITLMMTRLMHCAQDVVRASLADIVRRVDVVPEDAVGEAARTHPRRHRCELSAHVRQDRAMPHISSEVHRRRSKLKCLLNWHA